MHWPLPAFSWPGSAPNSVFSNFHCAVDGAAGRITLKDFGGMTLSALTSTEFRWHGGPANVPTTFRARLILHGSMAWGFLDTPQPRVDLVVTLDGDHADWQHRSLTSAGATSPFAIDDTVNVIVTSAPNDPFRLCILLRDSEEFLAQCGFTAQ